MYSKLWVGEVLPAAQLGNECVSLKFRAVQWEDNDSDVECAESSGKGKAKSAGTAWLQCERKDEKRRRDAEVASNVFDPMIARSVRYGGAGKPIERRPQM